MTVKRTTASEVRQERSCWEFRTSHKPEGRLNGWERKSAGGNKKSETNDHSWSNQSCSPVLLFPYCLSRHGIHSSPHQLLLPQDTFRNRHREPKFRLRGTGKPNHCFAHCQPSIDWPQYLTYDRIMRRNSNRSEKTHRFEKHSETPALPDIVAAPPPQAAPIICTDWEQIVCAMTAIPQTIRILLRFKISRLFVLLPFPVRLSSSSPPQERTTQEQPLVRCPRPGRPNSHPPLFVDSLQQRAAEMATTSLESYGDCRGVVSNAVMVCYVVLC